MRSTTTVSRRVAPPFVAAGLSVAVAAGMALAVAPTAVAAGFAYTLSAIPLNDSVGARDVAVDEGTGAVYVSDYGAIGDCCSGTSRLLRVDPQTGAVEAEITLPGGPGPIAVDQRSHRIYAVTMDNTEYAGTVNVVDPTTSTIVASVPAGNYPTDALVSASGDLYISNHGVFGRNGSLQVIDTATNATTATLLSDQRVGRLDEDPRSGTVWAIGDTGATNNPTTHVTIVGNRGRQVVGTVGPFAPAPFPAAADVAIDTTRGFAYLSRPSTTAIEVYDTATRQRVDTIADVPAVVNLSLDPVSQTIYASAFLGPAASVVDLISRRVTETFTTPVVDESTVNPRTHTFYGTNGLGTAAGLTVITQAGAPAEPPRQPACAPVVGLIGAKYAELGGCDGVLGCVTSSEQDAVGGNITQFERGDIYFSPATGAHAITGAIAERYRSLGGQASRLGYPTTDELDIIIGRAAVFQHGFIFWNPFLGAISFSI